MTVFKSLGIGLLLTPILFRMALAQDVEPIDCTDPLSYGQSFDALKSCRSHRPRYIEFQGQRVRIGAEMMICELENEVSPVPELVKYCEKFIQEFPSRSKDLSSEVMNAVRFARTTLIQIEGVPFFLSQIYDPDSIAERMFGGGAWEKAREILDIAPAQLFYDRKLSLLPFGAEGELIELPDHRFAWTGELKVRLYRNTVTDGEYAIELIAETRENLFMELAFDPERANDISPLGVYVTSFDMNRAALLAWVEQQID